MYELTLQPTEPPSQGVSLVRVRTSLDLSLPDPQMSVLEASQGSSHSEFPGGSVESGICGMMTVPPPPPAQVQCATYTAVQGGPTFFLYAPTKFRAGCILALGHKCRNFSPNSLSTLCGPDTIRIPSLSPVHRKGAEILGASLAPYLIKQIGELRLGFCKKAS